MATLQLLMIERDDDLRRLKQPSKPVRFPHDGLPALVDDLFETMAAAEGIGMAAAMAGVPLRVMVVAIPPMQVRLAAEQFTLPGQRCALINPRIIAHSRALETAEEGNLCAPGFRKMVARWAQITVDFYDLAGKKQRLRDVGGLFGRVIQHELDLFDGKMFAEPLDTVRALLA